MKHAIYLSFFILFVPFQSMADDFGDFPKGKVAPNVHHTGTVWLNELSEADGTFDFNITLATFAPGAKLDWHKHPGGQILIVTDGVGYYQERGRSVEILRQGDMAKCPPGVEHWHASTPNSPVSYIATTMNHPDGRTVWLEPVTEKEYSSVEP